MHLDAMELDKEMLETPMIITRRKWDEWDDKVNA